MLKELANSLKSPFAKAVIACTLILLAGATGFYYLELEPQKREGFFAAIWWIVVTLTTVGYGDIVPQTTTGRIIGIVVMFMGIGLVSTLSGNLASMIIERHAKKRKGLLEVNLQNHVLILGWNANGLNLIRSLLKSGALDNCALVLINQLPQEEREDLALKLEMGDNLHFVWGNPSHEGVVRRAKPQTAKLAYLLSQDGIPAREADQQNIYAALTLHSLAPKLSIYGEVILPENKEYMQRAGVGDIVVRGEFVSHLLGLLGATPAYWPFFQSLIGIRGQSQISYRKLAEDEKSITWGELYLRLRKESSILPLALFRESRQLSLTDVLDQGQALDKFILELFAASGQKTQMGRQSPNVILNPEDSQSLEGYDGILFLKPSTV